MSSDTDIGFAAGGSVALATAIIMLVLKFCNCFGGRYRCFCTTPDGGCGMMCRDTSMRDPREEVLDAHKAEVTTLQSQIKALQTQVDTQRADYDKQVANVRKFYEEAVKTSVANATEQMLDALDDENSARHHRHDNSDSSSDSQHKHHRDRRHKHLRSLHKLQQEAQQSSTDTFMRSRARIALFHRRLASTPVAPASQLPHTTPNTPVEPRTPSSAPHEGGSGGSYRITIQTDSREQVVAEGGGRRSPVLILDMPSTPSPPPEPAPAQAVRHPSKENLAGVEV